MSTREERRQARIVRLVEQLIAAGATWAEAEYQAGVQDGRLGTVAAHLDTRRAAAEARHRDIAAKLAAAVTPADESPRLPLAIPKLPPRAQPPQRRRR